MRVTQCLLLAFALAVIAVVESAALDGDDDVLYLTKLNRPALRLRVLRDTQLNMTRAPNTYLTFLSAGQTVEVLAVSRRQLQVRGRMSTGAVQGWVSRKDIEPISDELLTQLSEAEEKQKEIDAAIKRKEVIFGMTREDVVSILGRPTDKSSVKEQDGDTEIWTYYSYRSLPFVQSYGIGTNVVTQYSTQKVRTGSKVVSFKDGKVVRIEQKTETPAGYPEPTYPTPIILAPPGYSPKSKAY